MKDMIDSNTPDTLTFRKPESEDGSNIWELIKSCKPLDENSMYCNLIQCDHFADTCILAERNGVAVGWISGYLLPDAPDTLFVWQVAVSEEARGLGLAGRMLDKLLSRDDMAGVLHLKTTITRDNDASWGLFRSLAERHNARLTDEPHFRKDDHFDGEHATEHMVTIHFPAPVAQAA
ncbi:diaminobutyrate acetyltransferase [Paracoccus sp. SCSIO 75233]|uniref:diaminobutyrate acetyltransferase n=1 Tax=Paracoccus sp. SCSIO 75233 TaxID=3017782 RepID=UPI0022F13E9D|nr:diaminobutyrate acetyltransferase [Paracoccus sp. SCSIO 75233]WBU54100.1 diaminobutyrate acetyltransferase [Paracoccus sp. SCSIO 75233]